MLSRTIAALWRPRYVSLAALALLCAGLPALAPGGLMTWDGKHAIDQIDVTAVYFLPRDRTALPDWKDRIDYFARRVEQFHAREFGGQSTMRVNVVAEPFRSARTMAQLRDGDANFIFFQTLGEVNDTLDFGAGERRGFPILLVLSDINWRPLDDFYRVSPNGEGGWKFEGHLTDGRHFPGSESGGARATYLANRGVGWGLVSADGWRVPYAGSDCVVYHEGLGHTVGLPHPEPGNNSVMGFGQYHGWLNQSWLDESQKKRLGWTAPSAPETRGDLYSVFTAVPAPSTPQPGQPASLKLTWPAGSRVASLRVRVQTDVVGPWIDVARIESEQDAPELISLGSFDRPTPVAYRVEARLTSGEQAELWGYFQVRSSPDEFPRPGEIRSAELAAGAAPLPKPGAAIDVLELIDVSKDKVQGEWQREGATLVSPKQYGARIEVPYTPSAEYQMVVIAEPLDEPNALILGQRAGNQRFLALLNYQTDRNVSCALENVDGKNVGANTTTVRGPVFVKGRLSQIICTVRKDSVIVSCDGVELIHWKGASDRLSLSEYWSTPHSETLFLGSYDCRYRIHRLTLTPLSGTGKPRRESRGD